MEIIIIILAIIVIASLVFKMYQAKKSYSDPTIPSSMTGKNLLDFENKIARKFNSILKTINSKNIDEVKTELLECLDEYKVHKMNHFIESEILIERALKEVRESRYDNVKTLNRLSKEIHDLKCKSDLTQEEMELGAQYTYNYDSINKCTEQLSTTEKALEDKKVKLNAKVKLFKSKYDLKRSKITLMIVNSISINDVTSDDLKLNDLISEFDDKAMEAKVKEDVISQINGIDNHTSEFDMSEYLQKFKDFN